MDARAANRENLLSVALRSREEFSTSICQSQHPYHKALCACHATNGSIMA
jgi:hypothetical protein